ncbi:hypothetical protein AUEXF2481DRAFT_5478 [Aureobasidium subglaciale EXF-2481]|uniref:Enoyl reductase (ER) domain-containing protein n=1 Tax=Aureobasidium subglaciale (strain EXF-2481) TaxID=1043005 RepID=A0A074YKI4_AURSE|nr:uncharacterized protein AUEXF2481DRAFT_5478 [Aureobasidium subglaciale EXF-2481]KEQ94582.1 hypothetical protein AUEXF2481DRAFT_5478 [Aureobasidium subglaciale EXF-2481]
MASAAKAWTFTHDGYPAGLHKSAIAVPSKPSASEVYIRVKAAALNPVDIQLMNLPIWKYLPSFVVPLEKGVAEDFSGVVELAGQESGFKSGDEVYGITFTLTSGTLQELTVVDTKSSVIVKKPYDMSWEQAAALPLVWLTARTTIANVEPYVKSTQRLVVLGGSSGVGMYVLYVACERGWEVLTTCSSRNIDFVKSMGAKHVVDYNTGDVPHAVREYNPAAIIDCVGGTSCVGLAEKYVTIMTMRTLAGKLGLGQSYECVNLAFRKDWLEETLDLDRSKIIIDSKWEFDQAKDAFAKLNTGRARGKVVVMIN